VELHYYAIETDDLSPDDRAEVIGLAIRTLESTVVRFEADIPWTESTAWPGSVRDAAEVLVTASGKTFTDEPYQRTGMLQRGDEGVWGAFAAFAGYAYDASAWSNDRGQPIVSLSDEGTAIVVRIDEDERHRLDEAIQPTRVVPLRDARTGAQRMH
jgi:hypothetical protein